MSADIGPFIQDAGRIHYGDDAASFAMTRELFPVEVIARFTIEGEPVSKSRARFTKRGSKVHSYTPEKTKQAEEMVAWQFRRAAASHQPDSAHEYGIVAVFFNATRQRRDVDNMIKLICDALNGIAWADDAQVREVSGRKTYVLDKEHARTEVLIYRLSEVDRPTAPCQNCGESMDIYRSTAGVRKYCSQACHLEYRRKARQRACATCGATFDTRGGRTTYCSDACQSRAKTADLKCAECGTSFTGAKSLSARKNVWCSESCRAAHQRRREEQCLHGHAWDIYGARKSDGRRYCRECNRIRVAARKATA